MTLSFTVLGTPQPQGSSKGFVFKNKNTGKMHASITSANTKLKPWRQEVGWAAKEAMGDHAPTEEAVQVFVTFHFAKPKSASKSLVHKITKPDIDKLLRGVLDAMTGIVFCDDSQVYGVQLYKFFGTPERAEISISTESARAVGVPIELAQWSLNA